MSNSKDRVFIIYLADVDVKLFFVLETMHTYQENYFGSSLFANKDLKLILIVLKNALIWDNLEKFWRRLFEVVEAKGGRWVKNWDFVV